MSWLFSQVLVEEYLGDICSDGEQSVPLNGRHIQQAYCAPDKMTKFSRLSRFGMTYKLLTENRGEELLTLYRAGFPARISQSQDEVTDWTESDPVCGNIWRASWAKFDQDTSTWKTVQCSLFGDLTESLPTLPRWGMTQGGELYQQQTLVRPIKESESGLWRTPDTGAGGTSGLLKKGITHWANGQPIQVRLVDQVNNPKMWPTPVASDATTGAIFGKNDTFYTTSTGMPRKVNQNGKDGSVGLARLVQMWPTPSTRDYKGGYIGGRIRDGKVSWDTLDVAVQHTDNQHKTGGQLNPTWVEWLMGWPLGWTDLKPLEMDKFQKWQEQHGIY